MDFHSGEITKTQPSGLKRETAKFGFNSNSEVQNDSSKPSLTARKSANAKRILEGFNSKKVNEYPTFIEEGQVMINQKDMIEKEGLEGLSDIPENDMKSAPFKGADRSRLNRRKVVDET
jgi:hypothetical protein